MAELTARETKLIQYLNEAYGKEKELETALQAHIAMTTRKPYKKRLQDHLKETKGHDRGVEGRLRRQGTAARAPGDRRAGEDAEERQDRVLGGARGDRHLYGDRDAGRGGRRQ